MVARPALARDHVQGMSISYVESNKVAFVTCRKRLKLFMQAKCSGDATLHTAFQIQSFTILWK